MIWNYDNASSKTKQIQIIGFLYITVYSDFMTTLQPTKKFKYEQIIDHFSDAIKKGTIQCGAKLPSLRQTSIQFGCAVSVVLQAYQELEVTNIIRGVEKSGYFALPSEQRQIPSTSHYQHPLAPQVSEPSTFVGEIVKIGTDRSILPFGCAVPDPTILPLAKLKQGPVRITQNTPAPP